MDWKTTTDIVASSVHIQLTVSTAHVYKTYRFAGVRAGERKKYSPPELQRDLERNELQNRCLSLRVMQSLLGQFREPISNCNEADLVMQLY